MKFEYDTMTLSSPLAVRCTGIESKPRGLMNRIWAAIGPKRFVNNWDVKWYFIAEPHDRTKAMFNTPPS